jgi:hypothetical protein
MDRGKLPVGPLELPLRPDTRGSAVPEIADDLDVLRDDCGPGQCSSFLPARDLHRPVQAS